MVSFLYFMMAVSMAFIFLGKRSAAITALIVAILLCAIMFSYYATSTLKINW